MSRPGTSSELSLEASKDDAMQAVIAGLPEDAVVRDEDDGVGRFAGHRTIVIISRDRTRLMLFEGTWGALKPRLDDPQVEVAFKGDGAQTLAKIKCEAAEPKGGGGAMIGDLLNRGLTVAVLVVGYHWIRSIPIDTQLTITISVLGGLAWSVVAFLLPKKEDRGLEGKVLDALAPMVIETDEPDSEDGDGDGGKKTKSGGSGKKKAKSGKKKAKSGKKADADEKADAEKADAEKADADEQADADEKADG